MERFGLIAGLLAALCIPASAQFQGGGGFGTPGFTSPVAVSGPAYVFISSATTANSTDTFTQAFSLGGNAACEIVVGVSGAVTSFVSVVVGATTLNQDVTQGVNPGMAIYSSHLSACTGSQNVTLTTTGAAFSERNLYVWVLTGLVSSTKIASSSYSRSSGVNTPSSPTISVTAGDLMFGVGKTLGTLQSCAASTQAPTGTNSAAADTFGDDWLIASTNASFSTNCDAGASTSVSGFATYH